MGKYLKEFKKKYEVIANEIIKEIAKSMIEELTIEYNEFDSYENIITATDNTIAHYMNTVIQTMLQARLHNYKVLRIVLIKALNISVFLQRYEGTRNPLFMWNATSQIVSLQLGADIILPSGLYVRPLGKDIKLPEDAKKFILYSCEAITKTPIAMYMNESLEIGQKEINKFNSFDIKLRIANEAMQMRRDKRLKGEYADEKVGQKYGITDRTVRQYIHEIFIKPAQGDFRKDEMGEEVFKEVLEAARNYLTQLKEELRK
ncbi:hypothetical protein EPN96_08365 [bacterium]|nr:MAG: hypothetical protein EPN96_08365 [bacterium]